MSTHDPLQAWQLSHKIEQDSVSYGYRIPFACIRALITVDPKLASVGMPIFQDTYQSLSLY